jgi:hypothetical protein
LNDAVWIATGLAICFGVGAIAGAPFLPARRQDVETLIDLTGLNSGQTLIDLGSGDGRLLRAAAKRGIRAIGYEINPLIYVWSVLRCWPQRRLIRVRFQNFWMADLSSADAVVVFLITRYMPRLDRKLKSSGQRLVLVSYMFEIPARKPIKKTGNSFVYKYGSGPKS